MARIIRLWDAASKQDSALAELVRKLADEVTAKDPDYFAIERCARDISDLLGTTGDALPIAEEQLGAVQNLMEPSHFPSQRPPNQEAFGLDDEKPGQEALVIG